MVRSILRLIFHIYVRGKAFNIVYTINNLYIYIYIRGFDVLENLVIEKGVKEGRNH